MDFPLNCLGESAFISLVHLALYSQHEERGERPATEAAFEKAHAIMTRKIDEASAGNHLIDLSVEIDERADRLIGCNGHNLPGMLKATMRTGSNRILAMRLNPWSFELSDCPVNTLGVLLDDLAGGLSFYLMRYGDLPPEHAGADVKPEALLQMRCLLLAFNPPGIASEVERALALHLAPVFRRGAARALELLPTRNAAASKFVFELLHARCEQALELCPSAAADSYLKAC